MARKFLTMPEFFFQTAFLFFGYDLCNIFGCAVLLFLFLSFKFPSTVFCFSSQLVLHCINTLIMHHNTPLSAAH